jgi:NADPH-dependent F420 reductase
VSTTLNVGIVGGTGPAGAGLAVRLAAAGIDVHLGSRDEARAQSTAESLNERWALDAPIVGVTNVAACHRDVVVLATSAESIVETAATLADELAGRIVVCMANLLVRTKRSFEAVLPPEGSVAKAVQAAAPGSNVVAAFQNLPAAALADLERELRADVLICGDDKDAVATVMAITSTVAGLDPIDAGALVNAAGVEALTAILLNVNRSMHGEFSVRLVDLHGRAPTR